MTSRTWVWRYYSVSPLIFFHRTRSSCCVAKASFLLHYERTFPRNVANIVSEETRKFRWLRRRSSFVKFVPKTSPLMLPLIWRSSKRTHSKRAQRPRNLGNGRRTGLLLASYVNRPYAESILLSTPSMRANEARQARLSYDTTYGRQVGRCR